MLEWDSSTRLRVRTCAIPSQVHQREVHQREVHQREVHQREVHQREVHQRETALHCTALHCTAAARWLISRPAAPHPPPPRCLLQLRCSCADIYTLDGGKLSGKGVVSGSGFRVAPMEELNYRWVVCVGGWGGAALPGCAHAAAGTRIMRQQVHVNMHNHVMIEYPGGTVPRWMGRGGDSTARAWPGVWSCTKWWCHALWWPAHGACG
jgi:hypothetical protein